MREASVDVVPDVLAPNLLVRELQVALGLRSVLGKPLVLGALGGTDELSSGARRIALA